MVVRPDQFRRRDQFPSGLSRMAAAVATRRRGGRVMATTNGHDAGAVAAATLYGEARLLDRGEWTDWVAMYRADAVYWVPAWLGGYGTTNDPNTQCSLLYHDARRGREERVARIESRKSITALP